MSVAPILLFTYNRLDSLKKTVSALQDNYLAKESELYIFSDSAKNKEDALLVSEVRNYLKTIDGFKSVKVVESETNKGLANSIISGVSKIFEDYDKIIVLEDDLITSSNFLAFMNQSLEFYEDFKKIYSIAGFSFRIKGLPADQVYFTKRASSWGWATWKDRWQQIDWAVEDYPDFKINKKERSNFNRMGSDMAGMLDKQMKGKINSWAIRWCYHQFKQNYYTVYPAVSKVQNIGFGKGATHTKDSHNRYHTDLDESGNTKFIFSSHIETDPKIFKQVIVYYSIPFRLRYKLLNLFFNLVKKK